MTECDRIIEQGILPKSFFEEEVRCEFLVTEKRKKIWAIEIDIYLQFAKICNEHGLKFWADGGTLLGAIRHNGFIPWDDDMDFIMPRDDYNKLLEIGHDDFKEPYFLQTPHTDKFYGYSFAKLRNSNTTVIPRVLQKAGFNHGIHIDIFPLDFIDLNTFETDRELIRGHIMKNSSFMKRNSVELLNEKQLNNFKRYKTDNPIREYDVINSIASNFIYKGSEFVANVVYPVLKPVAQIWKASWYYETITCRFETLELPVPVGWKERLLTQYGDYMKVPPVEQRGNWHTDVFWDTDKSYIEYV